MEKEFIPTTQDNRKILHYEVIVNGTVDFWNESRAICNSYICKNMIQGVRPTPVYEED